MFNIDNKNILYNKQIGFIRGCGTELNLIRLRQRVNDLKHVNKFYDNKGETSENIRKRVNDSRMIQINRYKEYGIFSNSELTPKLIQKFCKLDRDAKDVLEKYFEKYKLSGRAYSRILKVARTIADLEGKENIDISHITEAIQYRCLDKS